MEQENNNMVMELAQPEVNGQETNNTVKESMENVIREKAEGMKLKFCAKVNVLIEDKELCEKLHEIISDAVNEAVATGQVLGVPEDMMKSVTDTFAEAARSFGCLGSATRAETYKKLFHNQRIITAHLMSAAQILQLQIGDTESLVLPATLPFFGTMEKTFAPTPPDGIVK